ncbi:hypothetical protein ACFWBC_04940 [Streptomyces sp. NPDC059985]|uniref:hypothetical protein n=1 Tax=Streptomyces sp. NPDC059985 TaxID=3347025 RepID=UPI0036C13F75
MGGLLTTASTLSCPHGGQVTAIASQARTRLGGAPVVLATDTFVISGCPFVPVSPQPCVLVQWQLPAARGSAAAAPTLTRDSVGFCVAANGAVQGGVLVHAADLSVEGM